MGRMSERAIEADRNEGTYHNDIMEEMYITNAVVEAAEFCANDTAMFELFIRKVYELNNNA